MDFLPQSIYSHSLETDRLPSVPDDYLFSFLKPDIKQAIIKRQIDNDTIARIEEKQRALQEQIVVFSRARLQEFQSFATNTVEDYTIKHKKKNLYGTSTKLDSITSTATTMSSIGSYGSGSLDTSDSTISLSDKEDNTTADRSSVNHNHNNIKPAIISSKSKRHSEPKKVAFALENTAIVAVEYDEGREQEYEREHEHEHEQENAEEDEEEAVRNIVKGPVEVTTIEHTEQHYPPANNPEGTAELPEQNQIPVYEHDTEEDWDHRSDDDELFEFDEQVQPDEEGAKKSGNGKSVPEVEELGESISEPSSLPTVSGSFTPRLITKYLQHEPDQDITATQSYGESGGNYKPSTYASSLPVVIASNMPWKQSRDLKTQHKNIIDNAVFKRTRHPSAAVSHSYTGGASTTSILSHLDNLNLDSQDSSNLVDPLLQDTVINDTGEEIPTETLVAASTAAFGEQSTYMFSLTSPGNRQSSADPLTMSFSERLMWEQSLLVNTEEENQANDRIVSDFKNQSVV